jgi:hypothetical protein
VRGHEQILADRRNGVHPAIVWVDCDGYNPGFARLATLGCRPRDHLEIGADENPLRLDLRCVVGLLVDVYGSDERRVAAVARACVEHGARQVIASHSTFHGKDRIVQTHRVTFTNEELAQWPQ